MSPSKATLTPVTHESAAADLAAARRVLTTASAALTSLGEALDVSAPNMAVTLDRMVERAREDLKSRGIKDADKAPIPEDLFRPQAESRVRMGLVVSEFVLVNSLHPKPAQVKEHIERLASSYEKPEEVSRWYYSDKDRLAEVEALVMEENVTQFVLSQVKVKEKIVSFEELMGQS